MWHRYRDPEPAPSRTTTAFDLEVDGERFRVEVSVDDETGYTTTGYDWLSGPNPGYGFGLGGPPGPTLADHRRAVRQFLAMVDPVTGYIEDDQ